MLTKKTTLMVSVCALTLSNLWAAQAAKTTTTKSASTTTTTAKKDDLKKDLNTNIRVGDIIDHGSIRTDLKTRYVNTMQAMQESDAGKEVSAKIEKERNQLNDKVQKRVKDLQTAETEFNNKKSTLNASARTEQDSQVEKMRRELTAFAKDCEDQLKLTMAKVSEELTQVVEESVAKIAQAEGFDVVADIYTGRTIWVSEKAMITDDLVSEMNKVHTKDKKATPKKTATA
jgi:Skp family chaperone for outer membrane proteins